MFPILPGQQNFLTGNMGELRPGHFHAGLDIKTKWQEGLPVYAAAKGYVYRVSMAERGYGNVVFMKHPNGHVTVYAHIKHFEPRLDSIVTATQYKLKSFEADIYLNANQLNYNKGDVLAYSGNTGSSGGPHLHFEIRDSSNRYLNPLEAGFAEIKDNKPPFISKALLKPLHKLSRINDDFAKYDLNVRKVNNNLYIVKDTVSVVAGYPVGLEVNTYDLMSDIYNLQGVNFMSVTVDDRPVFDFALQKFSLDESHCIDVHVDYEILRRKGSWYHKCYVDDGNIIESYKAPNRGFIVINDTTRSHKVVFTSKDLYGNASQLVFYVSAKPHQIFYRSSLRGSLANKPKLTEQLFENILKLEYADKPKNMNLLAELHCKNGVFPFAPSYMKGKNTTVYLLDLKKYLPDSITICDFKYPLNFRKMIAPRQKVTYKEGDMTLEFNEKTLFDTLYLRITQKGKTYNINDYTIPFFENLGVKFEHLEAEEDKDYMGAYSDAGRGRLGYAGGNWSKDSSSLSFKTKGPGGYTVSKDKNKPYLKVLKANRRDIMFKAADGGSGIGKYECYVNNEWVLMHYDYKKQLFWSKKLDKKSLFTGEYVIRVTDKIGNVAEQKGKIRN